ncbi:MAG: hypothetical protein A2Y23_13020 [Clostridiales bacterium GWB2_37_7]|nr:MAG: hypothetical protein A2Y23_13020 [Clostridiales bacterium GWB2_37_7]
MRGRALQKQNKYYQWWANTEKRIQRLAIFLFIVLYALQLFNFVLEQRSSGPLSYALGKLEGVAIAESQTQINTGTIELSVMSKSDYSNIDIYLNGEFYQSFHQKSITLQVKNNDIIEVSGIKSEYPATIKITSITDNVISPKQDNIIKVSNNFKQVGRIRLK